MLFSKNKPGEEPKEIKREKTNFEIMKELVLKGDYLTTPKETWETIVRNCNPKFTSVRFIDSGGEALGFFAIDEILDRPVFLKIWCPYYVTAWEEIEDEKGKKKRGKPITIEKKNKIQLERLIAGSRLQSKISKVLTDGKVPEIYEINKGESPYVVMEFVKGKSYLDAILELQTENQVISLFLKVARIVKQLHDYSTIHRDLKSKNIIITEDQVPYLIDWGLSKRLDIQSSLTTAGEILGTPQWMNTVDLVTGADTQSYTTDIDLLGALFYTSWSKKEPTIGVDAKGKPERSFDFAEMNIKYISILMKATANNKDDRYQNVQDMIFAIQAIAKTSTPFQTRQSKALSVKNPNLETKIGQAIFELIQSIIK